MKNVIMPALILFAMSLTSCGKHSEVITAAQGPAGANGANAPARQFVQLCPGANNYGASVEFAECIEGRLYGVYSANNGYMNFFADGNYQSNAVGAVCSFTITGCTVTPL